MVTAQARPRVMPPTPSDSLGSVQSSTSSLTVQSLHSSARYNVASQTRPISPQKVKLNFSSV